MFKLLLICLLGLIANAFADLGPIKVNSYLNQPFNALITINGISTNELDSGLKINLASFQKYQEEGLTYSPELNKLQLKIIKTNRVAQLQITSNDDISAPILVLLLHYQLNQDDFYQAYTIFLDPINLPTRISNSQKNTANIISKDKSIPVNKVKPTTNKASNTISYQLDYSSDFVQDRLANFNPQDMLYFTESGDNLYTIARFLQLVYSGANLSLNQLMLALGLVNYTNNKLFTPNHIYQNSTLIYIPNPRLVNKLTPVLVDAYLWDHDLNKIAKQELLTQLANLYNSDILITDELLFKTESKTLIKSPESKVLLTVRPVLPISKPWYVKLLAYKYLLLLIFLVAFFLFYLYRCKEQMQRKIDRIIHKLQPDNNSSNKELNNSFNGDLSLETDYSANNHKGHSQTVNSDTLSLTHPPIDLELLTSLEKILSIDSTRNDIRLKLVELYLQKQDFKKLKLIMEYLNNNLSAEDALYPEFIKLKAQIKISDAAIITEKDIINQSNTTINLSSEPDLELAKPKLKPNNISREINFVSSSQLKTNSNPAIAKTDFKDTSNPLNLEASQEIADLSSKLGLTDSVDLSKLQTLENLGLEKEELTGVGLNLGNPNLEAGLGSKSSDLTAINTPDAMPAILNSTELNLQPEGDNSKKVQQTNLEQDDSTYQEQLSLANLYYQIEEINKVQEILANLIYDPKAPESIKVEAKKLLKEYGLSNE